ncbi:hypothetical protein [Advenella sp. S44]|uniref:hypothetical protein n=1 Tax=Advenella sp. S44 TaxID=1982755 RepID=UPI001F5B7A61|nr:hypothetical protein [Advenella sp. S44]
MRHIIVIAFLPIPCALFWLHRPAWIRKVTLKRVSLKWQRDGLAPGNRKHIRRIISLSALPGLTGGWLLLFIQSCDELTMSVFVTTPGTTTLPV